MMDKSKPRLDWIDALRALAMLFVLYGHLMPAYMPFFLLTSPIKIPLFFAITGYLFSKSGASLHDFSVNLVRKLVIPWLLLSIIPVVLATPLKGTGYLAKQCMNIVSGKSVWYMPCCIIAEYLHYLVRKSLKKPLPVCVASLTFMALGLWMGNRGILDFAMANRAFVAQGFIVIGMLIRHYKERVFSAKGSWIASAWLVYLSLCALSYVLYPGRCIDVHLNRYYSPILCSLLIPLGCVAVFATFERVRSFPSFLPFIGRNTLIYYIWGAYAQRVLVRIGKMLGVDVVNNALLSPLSLAFICVTCGIAAHLVARYAPVLVGKRAVTREESKVRR